MAAVLPAAAVDDNGGTSTPLDVEEDATVTYPVTADCWYKENPAIVQGAWPVCARARASCDLMNTRTDLLQTTYVLHSLSLDGLRLRPRDGKSSLLVFGPRKVCKRLV